MSQLKRVEFSLPELTLWEDTSHEGNPLAGRTIIEVFHEADFAELHLNPGVRTLRFDYANRFGLVEEHLMAVHYSLADDDELPAILERVRGWYVDYLTWDDHNIAEDAQGRYN